MLLLSEQHIHRKREGRNVRCYYYTSYVALLNEFKCRTECRKSHKIHMKKKNENLQTVQI